MKAVKGFGIYLVATIVFAAVIFVVLRRIPAIHDLWVATGFVHKLGGLSQLIHHCLSVYDVHNGRIIACVLSTYIERDTFWPDVFNAIFISSLFLALNFLFNRRFDWRRIAWFPALFFAVSIGIRTEVYFYAFTFYLLPFFLIALFHLGLRYAVENPGRTGRCGSFVVFVFAFLSASWIEHVALGFCASVALLVVESWWGRQRALFRVLVLGLVAAAAGALSILSSPALRRTRQVVDARRDLFDVAIENFSLGLAEIAFANSGILLLLTLAILTCSYGATAAEMRPRLRKITLGLCSVALPVLASAAFVYSRYRMSGGDQALSGLFFDVNVGAFTSRPVGLRSHIALALALLPALIVPFFRRDFLWVRCFLALGVASVVPVLLTPNYGNRIVCALPYAFMFMTLAYLALVKGAPKLETFAHACAALILVFGVFDYLRSSSRIGRIEERRQILVSEARSAQTLGTWDYTHALRLPAFEYTDLYVGASPGSDSAHLPHFLEFFGLDPKTKIEYFRFE